MNRLITYCRIHYWIFGLLLLHFNLNAQNDTLGIDDKKVNLIKTQIDSAETNHQYLIAIKPLIELLKYYNEVNDTKKIHDYRLKLAKCYYYLGFYHNAIPLLEYCQVYYRQNDQTVQYVKSIHLLIFTYIKLQNIDMATYLMSQCENQKPDKNDPEFALEHSLIENILDTKRNISTKQNTFAKIIQYAKRNKEDEITQMAYYEVAKILQAQSLYEKSILAYNQSFIYAEKINAFEAKNELNYKLFECYKSSKNYERSIQFLLNYSNFKDSIRTIQADEDINKTINKHQSQSLREEGIDLAQDKRLFELKTRRANFTLYGLLFGIAAILIGGYFTIYFYQHKIEANEIIHKQNEQINSQKIIELESNLKLQNLNAMLSGQEHERDRIAKDLHDSLGGLLSTIKIRVDKMFDHHSSDSEKSEYEKIHDLVDIACKEVRSIAHDLKPGTIEESGLIESIGDLLNRYNKSSDLEITYQHYGFESDIKLRAETSLQIYRVIQELVHNSIKHGNPSEILVQISNQQSQLEIIVEDNGLGFSPDNVKKGMGLENIHSRVSYLAGDIHIDSNHDKGTSTLVTIPLNPKNLG